MPSTFKNMKYGKKYSINEILFANNSKSINNRFIKRKENVNKFLKKSNINNLNNGRKTKLEKLQNIYGRQTKLENLQNIYGSNGTINNNFNNLFKTHIFQNQNL